MHLIFLQTSLRKYILIACCCLATGLILFVLYLYASHIFVQQIIMLGQNSLGKTFRFTNQPEFSFFHHSITFKNVTWQNSSNHIRIEASCRQIFIDFDIISIFKGKLEIDDIIIDTPILELTEELSNVLQISEKNFNLQAIDIERIIAQNGTVKYKGVERSIDCEDINFLCDNLRHKQEADIKCDFILKFIQKAGYTLTGNLAFRSKLRYYAPNLIFRESALTFTDTENILNIDLFPLLFAFEGAYNIDNHSLRINEANLTWPQGQIAIQGIGNAHSPYFKGKVKFESSRSDVDSLTASSDLNLTAHELKLDNIDLHLRKTEGKGQIKLHLANVEKTGIYGNIDFKRLELSDDLLNALKTPVSLSCAKFAQNVSLDLNIKAATAKYKNFIFNKASAILTGDKDNLKIQDLELDWAGGIIKSDFAVNCPGNFSVNAKGKNIDLGLVLRQAGFSGLIGGTADFSMHLAGTGSNDFSTILSTLNGSASIKASSFRLPILKEIDMLSSKGKQPFSDYIDSFAAELSVNKGKIRFYPVEIKAKGADAQAQGNLFLPSGEINGVVNIRTQDMDLPLVFKGNKEHLSWSTGKSVR